MIIELLASIIMVCTSLTLLLAVGAYFHFRYKSIKEEMERYKNRPPPLITPPIVVVRKETLERQKEAQRKAEQEETQRRIAYRNQIRWK